MQRYTSLRHKMMGMRLELCKLPVESAARLFFSIIPSHAVLQLKTMSMTKMFIILQFVYCSIETVYHLTTKLCLSSQMTSLPGNFRSRWVT